VGGDTMELIDRRQIESITSGINLKLIVDQFLRSLDVKEKSLDTYRKALKQFINWISHNSIEVVVREHILAYKNYLLQNYSAATVSVYITAVRRLYSYLESEAICPNVCANIKGARKAYGFKKDCLTVSQAKELLMGIDKKSLKGLRDYAIINLLIRTGLRTIEVQRANIEDLRQDSGSIILYIQSKGADSKDKFVLLTDDTINPIYQYLSARGPEDKKEPLFASQSNRNKASRLTTRSLSRIVKQALNDVGLTSERLTAHSLRHTAITFALLGGANIQEVQQMARHSDINTTLIYAHNIKRIKNAAERHIDSYLIVED
jgi:integrase/recombinase XerC/integrase/recombinase XerD